MEPSQKTLPVARLTGTLNRQLFFALTATEKCGRNRHSHKNVAVPFMCPFDRLLSVKAVRVDLGGYDEGTNKGLPSKVERSPVMSAVLNEVRTFFEVEEGKNS